MKEDNDYRKSHTSKNYGKNYAKLFKINPYRSYLWEKEKKLLDDLVFAFFDNEIKNYLDFACGTGRIIAHIEQYAENSTGVDISESMLEVAHTTVRKSTIIKADLTKENILQNNEYDLITSFRFFLNAQPELREEVMAVLSGLLAEKGYLIFNIHNISTGLTNTISKVYTTIKYRKLIPRKEMSISEVTKLVENHGLKVEKMINYATFPVFHEDKKFFKPIVKMIDKANEKLGLHFLSTYMLFICTKK